MSEPAATAEEDRRRWRRQPGFVLTDASSSVTTEAAFLVRRVASAPLQRRTEEEDSPEAGNGCATPQSDSVVCIQRSRSVFKYHLGSDGMVEEGGEGRDPSFVSPGFVRNLRCSVLGSGGAGRSSSPGSPRNPFETALVSLIGRPFVNPEMFQVMTSPSEEMSESWTVEQLSELYPADIDTSRAVAAETDLEDPKERWLQAKIDLYFREMHAIVTPSPETKVVRAQLTPGGTVIVGGTRRKGCSVQTRVSIPPTDLSPQRLSVLNNSKSVCNDEDYFESVGEVCGKGSANTTLDDSCASMASIVSWNPRRKLFGDDDTQSLREECEDDERDSDVKDVADSEKFNEDVVCDSLDETADLSDLTTSRITDCPSLSNFRPGSRTGYRSNFESTVLEAPTASPSRKSRRVRLSDEASSVEREVDDIEDSQEGTSSEKFGQNLGRLSFMVVERDSQQRGIKGNGEFFSSVNLEETRAEFFSDGSESDDSQGGRHTPVVARDKSILRYAAVLERQVGTQTDISWPVGILPPDLKKALDDFLREPSPIKSTNTPAKAAIAHPLSCQTPDQGWLSKMMLLRSSSPKSFERRREAGLKGENESSPNYVIVKDSEMVRPVQEGAERESYNWKQVSPGTLSFSDLDHSASGPSLCEDDSFAKSFKTPQKRLTAASSFDVGGPDLSPIGLEDDDSDSPSGDPDSPMSLRCGRRAIRNAAPRTHTLTRTSTFVFGKENEGPRMSMLPILSQTGTESSFGNDDTGYQSYNPSTKSFQSSVATSSFAAVANSTSFGPSCDQMPERGDKNVLSLANQDRVQGDGPKPVFHRSSSINTCSAAVERVSPPRRRWAGGPWPGCYKKIRSVERNLQTFDDSVLKDMLTQKTQRVQRRVSALGCETAGSSPYMGESKRHWGRSYNRRTSTAALDSWRSQPSLFLDETASLDASQAVSLDRMSVDSGSDRQSESPCGDAPLNLNFSGIFR